MLKGRMKLQRNGKIAKYHYFYIAVFMVSSPSVNLEKTSSLK